MWTSRMTGLQEINTVLLLRRCCYVSAMRRPFAAASSCKPLMGCAN